jgi:serine protease Do
MADKIWDRCPKCLSKLTNKVECRTCGIIFDKYFQAETRKKELAEKEAAKKATSGRRAVLIVVGVLLVHAFAAAFYFLGWKNFSPVPSTAINNTVVKADRESESPMAQRAPVLESGNGGIGGGDSADKRFIQNARNATVSVQTSWGMGSGFFISESAVITNKHVVEFNREEFEEFRRQVEQRRKILDLEVETINGLKKRMGRLPDGPDRSQLAIVIQIREADLQKFLPKLQEAEKKLTEMEEKHSSQDVKILMADGTEHGVSNIITSDIYDLALLKVYTATAPVLKRTRDGRHLEQGDTVYTIGSPMGLANTVTSGVFSGYRKMLDKNEVYLQTDAPINPGNSGGPLIDGHGNVFGVNTMILSNAEGIGFAIPIETVFEEFSNSL